MSLEVWIDDVLVHKQQTGNTIIFNSHRKGSHRSVAHKSEFVDEQVTRAAAGREKKAIGG